ncbi:MAG: YncE family protein [Candidatus Nitrosopolaris sp.]
MILISTILFSHNNTSAQTYDSITEQRKKFQNNPQIAVGNGDLGLTDSLVADPATNKIYVANSVSNTVSIIDSDSGNVTNIPVGIDPSVIAVSPRESPSNKIYVANAISNSVSVIDVYSDRVISTIPVGTAPASIALRVPFFHPEKREIYVGNLYSNSVSVINSSSDRVISTIPVGREPSAIADGPYNRIYVANSLSNTISVINSSSHRVISTIPVGEHPRAIAVDGNRIYVANKDSVSVINTIHIGGAFIDKVINTIHIGGDIAAIAVDTSTDKVYVTATTTNYEASMGLVFIMYKGGMAQIIGIKVGDNPSGIKVIQTKQPPYGTKIYVANSLSNTISVINSSSPRVISTIPVGERPTQIDASNDYPLFYVANNNQHMVNTISVIDDSVDRVAAGITFNIHPANSGGIWCNNKEYPTNVYLYVANGTKCIARPAKDFEFSSWVENLNHNSTVPLNQSAISDSAWNSFLSIFGKPYDASATFDVNRFGTFTANFKAIPPPVPPEYWTLIITVIVTTIVGWSIPSIVGWIKSKTQIRRANQYVFNSIMIIILDYRSLRWMIIYDVYL